MRIIQIEGQHYELDVASAMNHGFLTKIKKQRHIFQSDIKTNQTIKWIGKKYSLVVLVENIDCGIIRGIVINSDWSEFPVGHGFESDIDSNNIHIFDLTKRIWTNRIEE